MGAPYAHQAVQTTMSLLVKYIGFQKGYIFYKFHHIFYFKKNKKAMFYFQ